jgi:CRP-like cAMP-binding protein
MNSINAFTGTNWLINALPRIEHKQIIGSSEQVLLEFGVTIATPDEPMTKVFFPVDGFISQVVQLENHNPLEMSLIGNEGMLGSSLVLDNVNSPMQAVVQGAGSCLTISHARFLRLLVDCPTLLKIIKRYHFVAEMQLAKTAACTHFHDIEQRLARWLLMTHDRAHVDHFHLTHDFLAGMLGVRRSGVTIAAGSLQSRSLISYTRGEILVLDRKGLEARACGCYKVTLADYARYLPA